MRTERSELRGEARRVAERVRVLLDQHEARVVTGGEVEARLGGQDTTRVAGAGSWSRVPVNGTDNTVTDIDTDDTDTDTDAESHPGGAAGWSAGNAAPWRTHSASFGSAPGYGEEEREYEYRSPAGRTSPWQRMLARLPVRADPGRRGALAIGLAVLLAAVVTGVWLMSQRPRSMPVSAVAPSVAGSSPPIGTDSVLSSAAPSSTSVPAGRAPSSSEVVIDVAGKVRRPGLYRLPPGARIDDALTAAGGPLSGVRLDSLNLAAIVVDGQQIVVGLPGAAATQSVVGAGDPASGSSATTAPVSLNTATLEQLETLPGVGPVTGQKILDWRSAHGSFTSVDQLNDVSGIGDITFKEISPLVTL